MLNLLKRALDKGLIKADSIDWDANFRPFQMEQEESCDPIEDIENDDNNNNDSNNNNDNDNNAREKRTIPITFSFKHGSVEDVYTEKEIEKIRYQIGEFFIQEANKGAIDDQTNKPFKCNEKKIQAIRDRLADNYVDMAVYQESEFVCFFSNWILDPKKFWAKCTKLSKNNYYISDISYVIDLIDAPKVIKDILYKENNRILS